MADEQTGSLPPPDDPPPAPDPPIPTRRQLSGITCEFCECRLTPNGEVLRMGQEAKRFKNIDDQLETAQAELARVSNELADIQSELRTVKAATARRDIIPL